MSATKKTKTTTESDSAPSARSSKNSSGPLVTSRATMKNQAAIPITKPIGSKGQSTGKNGATIVTRPPRAANTKNTTERGSTRHDSSSGRNVSRDPDAVDV